ncbi:hypothetical protein BS78_03G310100 [Paspalum vaginatum]|nr:hypothetical protein BS78_03G310100 [Paspalum vaginatum]
MQMANGTDSVPKNSSIMDEDEGIFFPKGGGGAFSFLYYGKSDGSARMEMSILVTNSEMLWPAWEQEWGKYCPIVVRGDEDRKSFSMWELRCKGIPRWEIGILH